MAVLVNHDNYNRLTFQASNECTATAAESGILSRLRGKGRHVISCDCWDACRDCCCLGCGGSMWGRRSEAGAQLGALESLRAGSFTHVLGHQPGTRQPPARPRWPPKPSETAMMASRATASNRMRFGLKREMDLGESEARSWVMSSHISPYQEPRQRRGWCLRP